MARLSARVPPYSTSWSLLDANWPSANVGNTSCALMPSASSTRERTSVSSAPGAIHPFGPEITSAATSSCAVLLPQLGQRLHQLLRRRRRRPRARAVSSRSRTSGSAKDGKPVVDLHHVAVGIEDQAHRRKPKPSTNWRALIPSGGMIALPVRVPLDIFRYRYMMISMARMATTTDAFNAVADASRRELLDALGDGEATVGDLVDRLGLSQPQVSKHLAVLRDVGLVIVRVDGQHRWYRVNGPALKPIHDWVRNFERTWNARLDRLDDLARRAANPGGTK